MRPGAREGCKVEPGLNAWYDGKAVGRRVLEKIHLGVAVDTPDGLFVPVLRDIGNRTPDDLRSGLERLRRDVVARTIPPEELRGYTFILSNFGTFGGRYANPIVQPPTVAILGAGRVRDEVVAVDGKPVVHPILPLSLTIDHRVNDAAFAEDGTLFVATNGGAWRVTTDGGAARIAHGAFTAVAPSSASRPQNTTSALPSVGALWFHAPSASTSAKMSRARSTSTLPAGPLFVGAAFAPGRTIRSTHLHRFLIAPSRPPMRSPTTCIGVSVGRSSNANPSVPWKNT